MSTNDVLQDWREDDVQRLLEVLIDAFLLDHCEDAAEALWAMLQEPTLH